MLRVRFHANVKDARPVKWPIKHPYWISGEGDDYAIIVAYADSEEYVYENWPEATEIDIMESNLTEYTFTSRFQKPDWIK